mgnify:CR=1 FL=1
MSGFAFDENRTPDENITLFIDYLKTVDASLATMLEANINRLASLPEGQARNSIRTEINRQIKSVLDSL